MVGFTGFFLGFARFYRVLLGFTEFYRVLLGLTLFSWVILGFTGLYRVLPSFTGFYRFLLGFSWFYRVLPGFTGFYWVSLGFTGFYRVILGFTGFYWVLLGFTEFYRVLPGFTEFHWVLLGFTGFYWVLPGFTGFYWVKRSFAGVAGLLAKVRAFPFLNRFLASSFLFVSRWSARFIDVDWLSVDRGFLSRFSFALAVQRTRKTTKQNKTLRNKLGAIWNSMGQSFVFAAPQRFSTMFSCWFRLRFSIFWFLRRVWVIRYEAWLDISHHLFYYKTRSKGLLRNEDRERERERDGRQLRQFLELLIPITRIFIGADCLSAPAQIPASLSDPKKAVPPLFSRFTWQRNPISITRSYLISLGPDLYYYFFFFWKSWVICFSFLVSAGGWC